MLLVAAVGSGAHALDAYTTGRLVGSLVPVAVGAVLIYVGVRRRRAVPAPTWGYGGPAAPPVEAPPDATTPSWTPPPAPAGPPPRRRGTWLIAGGSALVVLALLADVVRLADAPLQERRVVLPTSVLGLAIDQQETARVGKQLIANAPPDLKDPQAAVYGSVGQGIFVLAARASTLRPHSQLDSFRRGIERSGNSLTHGRDVDAGPLGGAARCWDSTFGTAHPTACVFVDRGSLVATLDTLGGGLDAAARRGLQVRAATVFKR